MISCKIKWAFTNSNKFNLTSYGPQSVDFKEIPKDKGFIPSFIESRAEMELGDKTHYGQIGLPNAYKVIFMDPRQGYGYIILRNEGNKLL